MLDYQILRMLQDEQPQGKLYKAILLEITLLWQQKSKSVHQNSTEG